MNNFDKSFQQLKELQDWKSSSMIKLVVYTLKTLISNPIKQLPININSKLVIWQVITFIG